MKFIKATNFRHHVVFLEQTHAVSGFENMTSLSASCWNCNSILKAFKRSFEMDQLSGELLVVNSQVTGIQRYQFQPKRDSYDSESCELDGGRMSTSSGEESTSVRLGNLNWYIFVILWSPW